ncbi:MAG: transporter [Gammaproteobacteria bacterium]
MGDSRVSNGVRAESSDRGYASAQAVDKHQFTLLNPAPDKLMREMSTDRPDTTESPYTVDAGHFQFELSLAEYAYNDDGAVRTDAFGILPSNIKIGLLNNVDLQFVFTPYEREETEVDGSKNVADGVSDDTQIRLKVNLWGNDGLAPPGPGDTAFAIMPFVKFPTGADELSNDHVEGGVIFPLAVPLSAGFGLGLMAEVDFVYNEESDDYGIDFVHTATVGLDIVGDLAGYVEYVGVAPHDTWSTYQAIGSTGLTYALGAEWIADTGLTFGISDNADDFSPFAGTSFRF